MRGNKDATVYLRHIVDAIVRIDGYMKGADRAVFLGNDLLRAGVIRELETIGEAAKQVDLAFRKTHSDIPWKKMAGMRDKLIHDYLGVDYDAVYETIIRDLPALRRKLNVILQQTIPPIA